MDARQDEWANPFGMDENCRNCPELADCRERIVHGYGDVGAEFLFVGASPSAGAERTGVPFTGDAAGERFQTILGDLGFSRSPPDATDPELRNAYLTYLTRCRHPDREAAAVEVGNCEPFLDAEVRSINPELLVPVGGRAFAAAVDAYTTRDPATVDVATAHATTIRGRGFELLPMIGPAEQTDAETEAFVEHVTESVFARDYRQTKGRRGR